MAGNFTKMISGRRGKNVFILLLVIAAPLSVFCSLSVGSVSIPISNWFGSVENNDIALAHHIIWELRWPRAFAAFLCGAFLAIAGVLMQTLLRNPLADPYILGISGGASTLVLVAILVGVSAVWWPFAAFTGSLFSVLLVFWLANRVQPFNSTRLLLTGVIVAAGWSAVIILLLSIAPDMQLRSMLFWLMGDLSDASVHPSLLLAIFALFIFGFISAPDLNQLIRGEYFAAALGVNINFIRIACYFASAIATGFAVSIAGSIGFVGLIVPHLLRMLVGSDHRWLIPASMLFGGSFLVLADMFARSVIAPQQLPVGVVTAMLGVPIFLWFLNRGFRAWHS